MEIGQTIHFQGEPYVLVGIDPMSVPDRLAHLRHALTGQRMSVPIAELEAEQQPEAPRPDEPGER